MPEGALRALAFDFGLRRTGVAVGQNLSASATPLTVLKMAEGVPDWVVIDELIKEWAPQRLVVGLPYTMQGGEQDITRRARAFAAELEKRYPCPVLTIDERLSSKEAEARLRELRQQGRRRVRREDIDCAAACVILESWFHSQRPTGTNHSA
ncbi:MAG: Holliday junction resolvase RuvX [Gammaproteobacteria bacterium]|nr:Holliday junction resolvase RuvX [Gammaproteobacteria bacterium]MDE1886861.1 Holliday junction resolvase RuvX [Gammaproteobacteria bacterium]MDE2024077.1 Holliday junction resolvase RuvX [Gammaproteobacteria bacterium]MDE2139341.1 Holliday junction resolvase RuvX [Gammaproteobacteria bacterium]